MAHPSLAKFLSKAQHEEIAPYVKAVPDMQPGDYIDLIGRRFANPAILDTTRRVAFDGSSRHTGFILPILRDALDAGGSVEGLSLAEALWARMCAGTREDGSEIETNDPFWDTLVTTAKQTKTNPKAWLEMSQTYGDLPQHASFSGAFEKWLTLIWEEGTEAALKKYTS
jgi:mannitol 2-dehydrogenase